MKRFYSGRLVTALLFFLAACGGTGGTQADSIPSTEGSSNILIAYFTWAENTYVENPDAVDVDAATSASVLLPSNAAKIAGWIQEEVGGDIFSIVVTEPYSSDYDECLDRAADEKAENARPELLYHVENMDDYDIVFLGFAGGIIGRNQEKPMNQGFALV